MHINQCTKLDIIGNVGALFIQSSFLNYKIFGINMAIIICAYYKQMTK